MQKSDRGAIEIQKVMVRDGKAAVLQCPNCLESKTISVAGLVKYRFNVRCKCKHVFAVQLEFRKKFRKQTNLKGYFKRKTSQAEWSEIHWEAERWNAFKVNCHVVNLSAGGIGFIPINSYEFNPGDFFAIKFALDDSAHTVISKRAIARVVLENYVGCEFVEEDKNDKKIGYYLLQ